jgi:uncharacterized protein YkwD
VRTVRLFPRRALATVVLTLVCGSTLPVTQPAFAEAGPTCGQRINAVRTRAGLPKVSGSGVLVTAAQRHANYRAAADSRSQRDTSAHYETAGRAYYSGVRPWDRTKAAGLRAGTWARQGENVVTGYGNSTTLKGVDAWLAAPYHRFPVLDANMRSVGCAASTTAASSTRSAEVLQMVWPWSATTKAITVWPLNRATGVAHSFDRRSEAPQPFRSARTSVVGPVVSLQASGYKAIRLTSTPTLRKGASGVPVYVSTPAGDSYLPDNAVMLTAKAPLAAGTTYTVTIRGQLQAKTGARWNSFTRTWSFKTS